MDNTESISTVGPVGGDVPRENVRPTNRSPWSLVFREMSFNRHPQDRWTTMVRGLIQTGAKSSDAEGCTRPQPATPQLASYCYSPNGVRGLVDAERQKLPAPPTPDGAFICPVCEVKVTAKNPYPHVYQCRRGRSPESSDPLP